MKTEFILYVIMWAVAYVEFFAMVHVIGKSIGDWLYEKKHNDEHRQI